MKLTNKVAIITGGQKGLGLAFSQRYLEEGAKIVVAARSSSEWLDAQIAAGRPISFIKTDVTDPAQCQAMVRHAMEKFGTVDILMNNAGFFGGVVRQEVEKIPTEEILYTLQVNVLGVFNCIKAVVPAMKAKKSGKIINIGSASVAEGVPFMPVYVASKGAVMAASRSLARELGPYNININTLAPTYTPTEAALENDRNKIEVAGKTDMLFGQLRSINRLSTPEDLTGLAVFLASSDSDFITGQMFLCEGGLIFN